MKRDSLWEMNTSILLKGLKVEGSAVLLFCLLTRKDLALKHHLRSREEPHQTQSCQYLDLGLSGPQNHKKEIFAPYKFLDLRYVVISSMNGLRQYPRTSCMRPNEKMEK